MKTIHTSYGQKIGTNGAMGTNTVSTKGFKTVINIMETNTTRTKLESGTVLAYIVGDNKPEKGEFYCGDGSHPICKRHVTNDAYVADHEVVVHPIVINMPKPPRGFRITGHGNPEGHGIFLINHSWCDVILGNKYANFYWFADRIVPVNETEVLTLTIHYKRGGYCRVYKKRVNKAEFNYDHFKPEKYCMTAADYDYYCSFYEGDRWVFKDDFKDE